MKAVLQITLTFFNFLPLQRWLSAAGLVLVAVALLTRILAGAGGAALGCSIAGGILLLLGPVFGGGVALRQGSSLATLMLRPHARVRLLLGTTLALNLVVLLVTLPFLLDAPVGPRGNPAPSAVDVFAVAWGFAALNWVGVFAVSRYRFGLLFLWIIPIVGANLLRFLPPGEVPDPMVALVAGLILWMAFAIWFLRQRSHAPLAFVGLGASSTEAPPPVPHFLASASPSMPRSMSQARQQWLTGGLSLLPNVVVGAAQAALVLILLFWLLDQPVGRDKALLGNLVYMGVHIGVFLGGYWLVGRSRALWLRGGLDRAGLLRHAETNGLLPALLTLFTAALVIIAAQAWLRPDLLTTILLNALAQVLLGLCLAYWGLSFTHGWSLTMAIESLGAFMLLLVGNIALGASRSPPFLLRSMAVLALLALLLRLHAHRRWRHLDWRVKRPRLNQGLAVRART